MGISIHAPRAGRDQAAVAQAVEEYISVHAPRAGRDNGVISASNGVLEFQSTRPVRGATFR